MDPMDMEVEKQHIYEALTDRGILLVLFDVGVG